LKHLGDINVLSEDERFNYAMQIDEVVTASVAEFSINPQEIENQIRRKLLPVLFKAIGMDTAKVIIADVIQITRLGVAGHH
jgi:type I restriction enzyme R subunit